MKFKINKTDIKLILEDYMQDMIDGMNHEAAVEKHGQDINQYVQDERILDKYIEPKKPFELGDKLKPKYPLFDDSEHTSLRMIRSISDKHDLPYEKSVDNAHVFLKNVGHIENDGNVHGGNHVQGSTIEGLYQTSDGQAQTARNRFHRDFSFHGGDALDKTLNMPVHDMDKQQQTAMTIAGLNGHGNSSNKLQHFSRMLNGDESAAKSMYFRDHHTRPDHNTLVRANNIFNKMNLKG